MAQCKTTAWQSKPAQNTASYPLLRPKTGTVDCATDVVFIHFDRYELEQARLAVPQLNYLLRKFRLAEHARDNHFGNHFDWLLGEVTVR